MKRFTETSKWNSPAFRKLPALVKLAWQFINDSCDQAGVWEVDWEGLSFAIGMPFGETFSPDMIVSSVSSKITFLDNEKSRLWIKEFVREQYPNLNPRSRLHQSVMTLLKRHSLPEDGMPLECHSNAILSREGMVRYGMAMASYSESLCSEEGCKGETIGPPNRTSKRPDTVEQAISMMATEAIPKEFVIEVFGELSGADWIGRNKVPVNNFRDHCRGAFEKTKRVARDYGPRNGFNGKPKPISGHDADHSPGVAWPKMKELE